MKQIGVLSDTHGFLSDRLLSFFEPVDEIWHAGDFGSIEVADRLAAYKPLKGVYGNIDGQEIRRIYPQHQRFRCEQIDVWITHIGGYPGRYDRQVKPEIFTNPPQLFISGHSHILKVINDEKLGLLHINPGAAGFYGFHKKSTALRFEIDGKDIKNMQLWESDKCNLTNK